LISDALIRRGETVGRWRPINWSNRHGSWRRVHDRTSAIRERNVVIEVIRRSRLDST
jgi:hypothetical protein